MALTDNLVSFWELEEASGTRNDSHGTNHLTDNNTVTQSTGKVGNCALFTFGNSEYLSITDNASVSIGAGVSVTWVAWIQIEGGASGILGKWGGSQPEYTLFFTGSAIQFSVKNTSNTTQTDLSSTASLSTTTWYMVVAQYDGSALKLSINNGTPDTVSYSGGINDSNGTFFIGSWFDSSTTWAGKIDQVGFWKRALTTTEITELYNSGNGRSYAYISSGGGGPVTVALSGVAATSFVAEFSLPGPPAEPSVYYDTTYVAPTGTVYTPADAGAFQAALTACSLGADIQLNPSLTYTGNFSCPAGKSGSGYVTIRSSSTLTTEGVRITTAQAAGFPKIVTNNAAAAIQVAAGASYFRFINCEITSGSTAVNGYTIGMGTGSETSSGAFPHHIIIDRCYVHGHASSGGRRGVMFAGSYQAVIDSYVSDYKEVGSDTQAIAGWTGYGPYKIVNNFLEGAGENVMFGGSDTGVSGLTPSDIEIRDNHFFKPLTWKLGDPSYLGVAWTIKNILEFKHAQRVIIEDNVFENCWSAAQAGNALVLTVRNQTGSNPWARVNDITFRNNEIHHAEIAVTASGFDEYNTAMAGSRYLIEDNYYHHMSVGALYLVNSTTDMTINHDTGDHTGSVAVMFYGLVSTRFKLLNTIFKTNTYGLFGDTIGSGNVALAHYAPDGDVRRNIMIGASSGSYPTDNFYPATTGDVGFVNYPTDMRLSPSSTYHNQGTDGTDPGAIFGGAVFKAAWAASCNQMIV